MSELHMYTDGTDTYIANDLEDLRTVFKEFVGCTIEEVDEDVNEDWEEVPGNAIFEIWVEAGDYKPEDPIYPPDAIIENKDGRIILSAKVDEWVKSNGRGFICSTEF